MGISKKAKTFIANAKEKAEQARVKGNMQTADVHANTVPHNDGFTEDMRRNTKPASIFEANMQTVGSLSAPVSTMVSLNTGPLVLLQTTPSFCAASAPGEDILTKSRPSVTRRPTQSEDLANMNAKASEKQAPSLDSAPRSEPTLPEELLGGTNDNGQMQPHGLEGMGDSRQTFGEAVAEQSMKLEEQARDMKALRDSNYHHVAHIEKLKDELQKEKQRHAQTTQEWRKATLVAVSANRPEANYKVDDDTLQKDYQNIAYDIGSWVAHYCVRNFDRVPESHLKVFNKLTLRPHKYDHVERTRELLLQSLIMHTLVDLVLNGKMLWGGKESVGLQMVQTALELDEPQAIPALLQNKSIRLTDVRDYSAWKAKTALLLSEKVKSRAVEANVGDVSAEMQRLLKPFLQRNIPAAWKELDAVIRNTIAFDLELSKSRALFQVHRWSAQHVEEMRFDEICMASPNGLKAAENGMDVELVLAPMITKTGNSDGDAFECLYLISPWTVVCYENRKQMERK